MMGTRRDLVFERLDEVMPEVDRLLCGHSTSKVWTLGQILHHLASGIRLIVQEDRHPPTQPCDPDQARLFDVRRRLFFRAGRFPEGAEIPLKALVPPPDADERVEAESLRHALRLLEEAEGPFPAHPMLGPLNKEEWISFHRIHCAHHLGFVRPSTLKASDP
jgi:hypothetical protein